jgi:hypothetical protein
MTRGCGWEQRLGGTAASGRQRVQDAHSQFLICVAHHPHQPPLRPCFPFGRVERPAMSMYFTQDASLCQFYTWAWHSAQS